MLVMFEVHLAEGADGDSLLTKETMKETNAQVMTPDEARKVGFANLPDLGPNVRLIAVAKSDANWVHRQLETSDAVASFRAFDVG